MEKRKIVILLIGIILILFFLPFIYNPNHGLYVGEVNGNLFSEGTIQGSLSDSNMNVGISVYNATGSNDSISVEIKNISYVKIRERKRDGEYEVEYSNNNLNCTIQISRGTLLCTLKDAQMRCEIEQFSGYQPNGASFYTLDVRVSDMSVTGNLPHEPLSNYDIRTYDAIIIVNNETFRTERGDILFHNDDSANIVISGHGRMKFNHLPVMTINGFIRIHDFDGRTGLVSAPEELTFNSTKVKIKTLDMPGLENEEAIPWVVEIHEIDSDSNPLNSIYLILLIVGILILGFIGVTGFPSRKTNLKSKV